jgi:dipeptidyl aminopeptidase/acylaminoacyl peptidase
MSLCVMPTAGGEVRIIDLGPLGVQFGEGRVCWSPDAREIAFSADDGSGNTDIYRVARDGGSAPVRVTIAPGLDIVPSWSPDGRRIAYTRPAGGETQVWVIPATGGNPIQATRGERINEGTVWAPDSDTFAYISIAPDDDRVEVWISALGDPSTRKLEMEAPTCFPHRFTDDGRELLVWQKVQNRYNLVTVTTETSKVVQIGKHGEEGTEFEHFVKLFEHGEKYLETVYSGGVHVYADGADASDIYKIRVAEVLSSEFHAGGRR